MSIQGGHHEAYRDGAPIDGRRRIPEIHGVAPIATAVLQQGAAMREIVRSIIEATTGTVAGVARASDETGAAARVLTAVSDLSRQSERLGSEVSRF